VVIDDLSASYEWNLPRDPRVYFVARAVPAEEGIPRTNEWFKMLYGPEGG